MRIREYGGRGSIIRICGDIIQSMTQYRIGDAARLLGVSDDTVRRWVSSDVLTASKDAAGHQVIDGAELAARAKEIAVVPG